MGDKHIAPEKADYAENVNNRSDNQKTVDIVLGYRPVQLNQREHNSINKIREQINRRS